MMSGVACAVSCYEFVKNGYEFLIVSYDML